MSAPSPDHVPDAPRAGRAIRSLALWTGVGTFLLIVVGGIVRVSDSGLGCGSAGSGFHGWPLCEGDVIPGVDLHAVIEYTHRALASALAIMMFALAVLAWRRHRAQRGLVRATIACAGLIVAQGLLGAATVEKGLDEALVAAHLGLAMLLLGLLVYVWRATGPEALDEPRGASPPEPGPAPRAGPGARALALGASAAVFLTILAGGYMAGTQNYGRPDYRLGDGAHHACGKEFPTCNGSFLPFGRARLVDIHLTHRVFMYIASLLVITLVVLVLRRGQGGDAVRSAKLLLLLLCVQVLVGALNVWLDEYEALIVLHLALGTLLWATVVTLTLQLHRVPSPAGERAAPERAGARPAAVTA